MSCTVAFDELRVDMYVHLEDGWLSHPSPLSSFRITSSALVAVLHGLPPARDVQAEERAA